MIKTLYICGFGLKEEDISLATLKILSNVEIILSPSIDENSIILKYLSLFKKDKIEFKNIRHIKPLDILKLLKLLFKKHNKIAVLFYGNPLFMNSISEIIISKMKDIKIITYPATSSFDNIFHLYPKLNLFDKKIIILNNRVLEKKSNNKNVWDVNSHVFLFGVENLHKSKKMRNVFFKLFDDYYGKKHPIILIHFSDLTIRSNKYKKIYLKNLMNEINDTVMKILYIPPKLRRIKNDTNYI